MNREQAKELLPIIAAFANGGDIQYLNNFDTWVPNNQCPEFTGNPSRYRIAPKPRKVWVNEYPAQYGGDAQLIAHTSKDIADRLATDNRVACYEIELPPLS